MTTYSYICLNCRNRAEVYRGMDEDEQPVQCGTCGDLMARDYTTDFGKRSYCSNWPMASYSAGVHPKQIPEMRKFDNKHNVPTDYTPDGDPVFRGPKHRRKYCQAHGLFDRNAGLNDPVPARSR